uniref:E3 ubiquitin-protein ligase ZNRF1 n=1 Tax=Globodera rostochiensis TaxID=31243 RepID=A0A914I216_GLORO
MLLWSVDSTRLSSRQSDPMGQRPSMQQSEVVRRPRAGSELSNGTARTTGSSAAAHMHHHRRPNSIRFRQPQNDTSSASSVSSASPASAHSSADEGVGGGAELARHLLTNFGLAASSTSSASPPALNIRKPGFDGSSTTSLAQQLSGGGGASAPSTSVRPAQSSSNVSAHRRSAGGTAEQRHNHRRLGGGSSGAVSSSSQQRVGRDDRRGDGTDRLQALLQSLEAMANASDSSSSSAQPTTVQLNKLRRSAPLLHLLGRDIKCPVCHKVVPSDDVEMHLVMCLTRPQLSYNDDVLIIDKGECAICLEEMEQGAQIARLPCLCIYHKSCIDEWFKRKNTCPEHPGND